MMVIPSGCPAAGQRLRLLDRTLAEKTGLAAKVFGIYENSTFVLESLPYRQFFRPGTNSKTNINSQKYHATTY